MVCISVVTVWNKLYVVVTHWIELEVWQQNVIERGNMEIMHSLLGPLTSIENCKCHDIYDLGLSTL